MLTYVADDSVAHRLDPRAKLTFQVAFAIAAISRPTPAALGVLSVLALGTSMSANLSPVRAVVGYRYPIALLSASVAISAATLGSPWIDLEDGVRTARAAYAVVLVLLVSAAYVRSTPVRHSRAAIQSLVPGTPGRLLGIGVSLVFRFVPVLRRDIGTIRDAMTARLGTERSTKERAVVLGSRGLSRAFVRADRLSIALQARCFAWNPTLPPLSFARTDGLVLVLSVVLVTVPLW